MSRGGDEMLEVLCLNNQHRTPIMAMPLEFVLGTPHNEAQRLHFSEVFCLPSNCVL